MKVPFLEYRAALAYNRGVFFIEHSDLVKTFIATDANFPALVELPRTRRDSEGNSHVSPVPLLLLLRRQAHTAFDVLSADQSHQAWLLLRPGLEAALILGKRVDDPENATIWQNREKNRAAYRKVYTGKALQSASLPGSDRIQMVLSRINDRFVHANIDYYHRHLDVGPGTPGHVSVLLNYFEDDPLQLANVLAFLHLLLVVQDALLGLFNKLFATQASLPSPLKLFEDTFGERLGELTREKSEYSTVLTELGAYSLPDA